MDSKIDLSDFDFSKLEISLDLERGGMTLDEEYLRSFFGDDLDPAKFGAVDTLEFFTQLYMLHLKKRGARDAAFDKVLKMWGITVNVDEVN